MYHNILTTEKVVSGGEIIADSAKPEIASNASRNSQAVLAYIVFMVNIEMTEIAWMIS